MNRSNTKNNDIDVENFKTGKGRSKYAKDSNNKTQTNDSEVIDFYLGEDNIRNHIDDFDDIDSINHVNSSLAADSLFETNDEGFENWIILQGKIITTPIKAEYKNCIFYNFRIFNGTFKMNCTITLFNYNEDVEKAIFDTLKKDSVARVSGKLFVKTKDGRTWIQINVKNWMVRNNENKRMLYKI